MGLRLRKYNYRFTGLHRWCSCTLWVNSDVYDCLVCDVCVVLQDAAI